MLNSELSLLNDLIVELNVFLDCFEVKQLIYQLSFIIVWLHF